MKYIPGPARRDRQRNRVMIILLGTFIVGFFIYAFATGMEMRW